MSMEAIPAGSKVFSKSIHIHAAVSRVWEVLTTPEFMKKWMFDADLEVITDWKIGNPFVIRGDLHGLPFENTGVVLQFEPERILRYTHLSSVSRLKKVPENFTLIEFQLAPVERETDLTITLSNFPTETIYKHLAYYWTVTLEIIKKMAEAEK